MNYEDQKTKLLSSLEKACGISFNIADSTLSDAETVECLKDILWHYNIQNNRKSFLTDYLSGQLSKDDITQGIHHFHIDENAVRVLYLLECTSPYPKEVPSLLTNLFPNAQDICLEPDDNHLLVILHYDTVPDNSEISTMALQILDILDTEAFVSFNISFDGACNSFFNLPKLYHDLILAMKIGNIFCSKERTFCFSELGLSRLLYNLPEDECRAFLDKHIDVEIFRNVDEEILNTINAFFDNDLSIAETSRQQFIHRNTLIYRLDKFTSMTGLDVRRFSDAVTCKIALMLLSNLDNK